MRSDADCIAAIQASFPTGGLFSGMDWQLSPQPLALPGSVLREIASLGRRLLLFLRAANEIYLRSAKGNLPEWIAGYLDAGKPPELIDLARHKAFRESLPRVIRPDLLLGANGRLSLTEIDNLPGGIGLTAWLNQTYAKLGFEVVGGSESMLSGFQNIFAGPADVVISDESSDYRPEMEWVVQQMNADWQVCDALTYRPSTDGRSVYRFFELFDLPQIPSAASVFESASAGQIDLAFAPKHQLEEKLWSALFWMRPLQEVWRQSIRGSHLDVLRDLIPYSWIVNPDPLPHFATIPKLEVNSWSDVGQFSQKERNLVLKISGFSDRAWGSRGVVMGSDKSQEEWASAVSVAINSFPDQPWILQEQRETAIIEHPVWNHATQQTETMQGRVRLCPYYFVNPADPKPDALLAGILATIVPADKKIIHGMRDAVLVPVVAADE